MKRNEKKRSYQKPPQDNSLEEPRVAFSMHKSGEPL